MILVAFQLLGYAFCAYLLMLFVWAYYLMVMSLKDARDWYRLTGRRPKKLVVFHSYLLMAIGAPFYVALNLLAATVLFLDFPKELQFTRRCQRLIDCGSGWRKKMAEWFCYHWLDPFDDGQHC
jgi:hypothetical protein